MAYAYRLTAASGSDGSVEVSLPISGSRVRLEYLADTLYNAGEFAQAWIGFDTPGIGNYGGMEMSVGAELVPGDNYLLSQGSIENTAYLIIPETPGWHSVEVQHDGTTYRGWLDGTLIWEQAGETINAMNKLYFWLYATCTAERSAAIRSLTVDGVSVDLNTGDWVVDVQDAGFTNAPETYVAGDAKVILRKVV